MPTITWDENDESRDDRGIRKDSGAIQQGYSVEKHPLNKRPSRLYSAISDDYADNKLSNRDSDSETPAESGYFPDVGNFRPGYVTFNEDNNVTISYNASNSELEFYGDNDSSNDSDAAIYPNAKFAYSDYNGTVWRVEFESVYFSNNYTTGGGDNQIGVGFVVDNNGDPNGSPDYSQNGVSYFLDGGDYVHKFDGGNRSTSSVSNQNWSNRHDIAFEIDATGSNVSVTIEVDGTAQHTYSSIPALDYYICIGGMYNSTQSVSETIRTAGINSVPKEIL